MLGLSLVVLLVAVAAACVPAGNPNGAAIVPAEAQAVNTSNPTGCVGNGTPASCTRRRWSSAVAAGGIITFDCGPDPSPSR